MRLVRPSVASSSVLLALTLTAPAARADRTSDAEDLFRRAKALMAQNKHPEACPLLGESYRLDRQIGTLLNLALCNEAIGKVASAWGEFRAVEQQVRLAPVPNESRAQLAREHAERLQARLSRLRVVVPQALRAPSLVVTIDGDEKKEPLWDGVPVDPGSRVVEFTAPGKRPATVTVKIDDEGVIRTVTMPPLVDAPVSAAPGAAPGARLEDVEAYAARRARRTTGFVVGGLGIATLAVGAAFGVAGIVNDNDAKGCAPCVRGTSAAAASDKATDRALVFANLANVTVPLGLLGAAVGAYLVLTAGPTRGVAVAPAASPGHAGLSVSGRW